MRTQVAVKFSDFYQKWMSDLEDILRLLHLASKMKDITAQEAAYASIVEKLTTHHKEFYKFKWALAQEDVLSFYSAPIWLTPFENANLWVTGWKPSSAFRLVDSLKLVGLGTGLSLAGLTEEQVKKIEALRMRMKAEEERVEREMERLQVAVADRKTVELVRLERRVMLGGEAAALGEVGAVVEREVKGWLAGLEKVMKMADCVRLKTLKGLLDILSPMQGVNFLASKAMVEIRIRKLGDWEKIKKMGV